MIDQDKHAFKELLTNVMAFYRQDISTFALQVWWSACQGYDLEQVRKALNAHAVDPDRGQFAPKPADVVRALQGTKTDRARAAWGKVMDAMQRVGAYQSVVFDDHVIHAVIEDLGGWMGLCRSDFEQLSFTEHRFCESYRAYAGRHEPLAYPAKLLGQFEMDNRHAGRRVAPPVLIGNPERAAEVLRLGGSGPKTQFTLASDIIPALGIEGAQA
jgi:Domain of unknown function (DUF6475)